MTAAAQSIHRTCNYEHYITRYTNICHLQTDSSVYVVEKDMYCHISFNAYFIIMITNTKKSDHKSPLLITFKQCNAVLKGLEK